MNLRLALFFVSMLISVDAIADSFNLVEINPGTAGSTTTYQDFFLTNLNGTALDGQTRSFDIRFSDGKFIVASSLVIDFDINQSGALGTQPVSFPRITGYLLDSNGNPMSASIFPQNGSLPAQIWPGWPFTLNASPFLPATTTYDHHFAGSIIGDGDPRGAFDIDPIIAYGIHFDLVYPDSPGNTVIGTRLVISSFTSSPGFRGFTSPIYISPDPIPVFHVAAVPETPSLGLLIFGLAGVILVKFRRPAAGEIRIRGHAHSGEHFPDSVGLR